MTSSGITSSGPIEIWDPTDIRYGVLDELLARPRVRLTETGNEPRSPGFYAVFLRWPTGRNRTIAHPYEPINMGTYPVYVGSSTGLRERMARHGTNMRPVASLRGGRDLWVASVALSSYADSLYSEQLLHRLLEPVWNQTFCKGFGSRHQGSTRSTQVPPPWSALHPGRREGSGSGEANFEELARRVGRYVATTTQPDLWPPI